MADKKLVTPNFKAVDKQSVQRARNAVQQGNNSPLTPPAAARVSTGKKGDSYTRWTESVTITQAYRSVTKSGLMDVTTVQTIRQSDEEKNNGRKLFGHFYINTAAETPENHVEMNEKSMGRIISLLEAAGLMPESETLSPNLLAALFPEKGKPGMKSKLEGVTVIAAVVQESKPSTDGKTNKPAKNADGSLVLSVRDNVEAYLADEVDEDDAE